MCSQTSTNLDYSDYPLEDLDLSDFSNSGDALSASCACCDYYYLQDGTFQLPSNLISQAFHPDSSKCCGVTPTDTLQFTAQVTINAPRNEIEILTLIKAVNRTGDTGIYGNSKIEDSIYNAAKDKAFSVMESNWNTPVKKLSIATDKCKKTFQVVFRVREAIENHHVSELPHYTINFINAPFEPDGRSQVDWVAREAKFNFGDDRSVLGKSDPGLLETHEYGHMLGLVDEYKELVDYTGDGDGTDYNFLPFDPREQKSNPVDSDIVVTDDDWNTAVKEADLRFGVDPGIEPGSITDNWQTNSHGQTFLPGRHWYVQIEKDIGGAHYNWPSYTPYSPVSSPDFDGLMGQMVEKSASRREYLITIVWAVEKIMRENGENVLEIEVM